MWSITVFWFVIAISLSTKSFVIWTEINGVRSTYRWLHQNCLTLKIRPNYHFHSIKSIGLREVLLRLRIQVLGSPRKEVKFWLFTIVSNCKKAGQLIMMPLFRQAERQKNFLKEWSKPSWGHNSKCQTKQDVDWNHQRDIDKRTNLILSHGW